MLDFKGQVQDCYEFHEGFCSPVYYKYVAVEVHM